MDPDRLKFLKEMLAKRNLHWGDLNEVWNQTYQEWQHESPWEMVNRGQGGEPSGAEMLEDMMKPKAKQLRRDLANQQFEAEDARSRVRGSRPGSRRGGIGDLVSESRYRRNPIARYPGGPEHTVSSVRRLLDKAKGITSLIPKGPGKAFSVLGPLGAMLGLAFDQLTAAPGELGSGEDEILRQLKGDTDGLSEKEMMQYWEQLADIKSFDDIY